MWTEEGNKVAFVQCVSEPVPGRPQMSRQSNRLKAFDTQTGQSLVVGRVQASLCRALDVGTEACADYVDEDRLPGL
ncbi:MAG: hypothetical protein Rhob2KO_09190 [Rhodopirellula baltica]